jgi:hypothetical protein
MPRWATVTWFVGALLIVSAVGFNAYRLRLDVEQTVGYFGANFVGIFIVLVLLGLLLIGAVALASRPKHVGKRQGRTIPVSIRKRYAVMTAIAAAVYIPMAWLVFERPLGDLTSILATPSGIAPRFHHRPPANPIRDGQSRTRRQRRPR